jgi:hypothetical protein
MMSDFNKPQSPSRRRSQLTLGHLMVAVFVIMTAFFTTQAQEPSSSPAAPAPTPSAIDKEIERLKKEKEKAELRKDIRETQPTPSTTPLEGKTTADENTVIETQVLTYKAMSDVADRIGEDVHQKFPRARAIMIYDADELENVKHYRVMSPILEGRIEGLKKQYLDVLDALGRIPPPRVTTATRSQPRFSPNRNSRARMSTPSANTEAGSEAFAASAANIAPAVVPTITAVTTGLKAFADLLALARTDTDIKGKAVSVEESAMVAETFRALRNRFGATVSLYYPKVVSPEVNLEGCRDGNSRVYCSPTLSALASLYTTKENADKELLEQMFDVTFQLDAVTRQKAATEEEIKARKKQIADLKLERLQAELKKPWTPVQIARFEKFIGELEAMSEIALAARATAESQLQYLAKKKNVLDQLQALNTQADQMVANLAKADEKTGRSELANFLRAENVDKVMSNNSYWLQFKSISAGGNNRTRQNLFRYFSGAKLDHSGGIIIEWALYDRNGVSVDSNKDSSYPGYLSPKEIQSGKLQDAVADQRRPQSPAVAKSGNQ